MQGNFITGAGYFFKGLNMLSQRGIWPFVILPLLANIGFFLFIGSLAYSYVDSIVSITEEALPDWLHFLTWVIAPLLWLTGGLATGYLSTFIVLILTSPFHALLAEKVEERVTGQPLPGLESVTAAIMEVPPRHFARTPENCLLPAACTGCAHRFFYPWRSGAGTTTVVFTGSMDDEPSVY